MGVALHSATIFDIQRFSLHDGPGIRTTVFFKGCTLSCAWCQNPESQSLAPEMAFYGETCRSCLACQAVCPEEAILPDHTARVDYSRCTACGLCARECPTNSLRLIGESWPVDRLLAEVLKDRDFFQDSGGGLTLSGGEPVLQAVFLEEFLPALKRHGIHVTMETAGHYHWERLERLLRHVDLVYYDIKHLDRDAHQRATGQPNELILDNFARLARLELPLQARMPMVPGINDDARNIRATAGFLREHGQETIHCLRYHNLGEAKLCRIDSPLASLGLAPQSEQDLARAVQIFSEEGIHAVLYD